MARRTPSALDAPFGSGDQPTTPVPPPPPPQPSASEAGLAAMPVKAMSPAQIVAEIARLGDPLARRQVAVDAHEAAQARREKVTRELDLAVLEAAAARDRATWECQVDLERLRVARLMHEKAVKGGR